MEAAEAAAQERMKPYWCSCSQTVFNRIKQSTRTYQLIFKGDISSLETARTQYDGGIRAGITGRLDRVQQDVLDRVEGLPLQ